MTLGFTRFFAAALLVAMAVPASAQYITLNSRNLRFQLLAGRNITLTARGVPVIRQSHLYIVKPGWTAMYLNQDNERPTVTTWNEGDVQMAGATYETDDAVVKYRFEMRQDDTFKVKVEYASKGQPAELEYDAGYINANVLAGAPYTAQTVKGPVQGEVPWHATSDDQAKSQVMPLLSQATFQTVLGELQILVEGSNKENSTLRMFDARGGTQEWAQRNPVFWLGIGVPQIPMGPEPNSVTVTYRFNLRKANADAPTAEGQPVITAVKAARVPSSPDLPIIPRPKEIVFKGDRMNLGAGTVIVIPAKPVQEERQGALELQEELKNIYGLPVKILRSGAKLPSSAGAIIAIARSGQPLAIPMTREAPIPMPGQAEAYTLRVRGRLALVQGKDARGAYFGAQTLKQLIGIDAKGVFLKPAVIRDWPSLGFRGVHWFGGPNSWPFHQKMLTRIIAPLKMNSMVFQVDFSEWSTQKDIWDKGRATPKDQIRKTVALARNRFIEPIPLVNSLGHSDWMFVNGKNLDVATDPVKRYQYDPAQTRVYTDILFPVMEEVIEIFKPRYFHIGHDEITTGGVFPPKGSDKTATELIIEDIKKVHGWVKERGMQSMIWGDEFLHYPEEATDAGNAPSVEEAAKRRAGLPKDIIITDWHYASTPVKYPSVGIWHKEGFKVIGAPWNDWSNIARFSNVLAEEKAMGSLQTTWAGWSMDLDLVKGPSFPQFVSYLVAAEYAWNAGRGGPETLGYRPEEAFLALWDKGPVDRATHAGFTVDLTSVANTDMWGWGRSAPSMFGVEPGKPTEAPSGDQTWGGIQFRIGKPLWLAGSVDPEGARPRSVDVPLNRKAKALHFLWGTTRVAQADDVVARLSVTWSDGSTETIPVKYANNILAFTDLRQGGNLATVWRGRSAWDEPAWLRRYTWKNPKPGLAVTSLTLKSEGIEAAPVLVSVTGEQ